MTHYIGKPKRFNKNDKVVKCSTSKNTSENLCTVQFSKNFARAIFITYCIYIKVLNLLSYVLNFKNLLCYVFDRVVSVSTCSCLFLEFLVCLYLMFMILSESL